MWRHTENECWLLGIAQSSTGRSDRKSLALPRMPKDGHAKAIDTAGNTGQSVKIKVKAKPDC